MMQTGYNLRKADRVNLITIIILVVLICGQVIMTDGLKNGVVQLSAGAAVIVIMVLFYFIPMNSYLRALLFTTLTSVVITGIVFVDTYSLSKHYMFLTTIALITLYFKKELILIHGILLNIEFVLLYLLAPAKFLSDNYAVSDIFTIGVITDGILILLYFLTKWGNDLVNISTAKEAESKGLLGKLNGMFLSIRDGANTLDNNIGVLNTKVIGINETSKGILESVQQISAAIQEEASSVNVINSTMNSSLQGLNQSVEISHGIMEKSNDVEERVEESWRKVEKVKSSMGTVESSISLTAATVAQLKESLDMINSLLYSIKDIAGQTNLLALNASIESARAGEQGKGFAVVAEQIRRLSEQSKEIVADITEVTGSISIKSEEASVKSIEGEKAAREGLVMMSDVAEYFKTIKDSFKSTNDDLNKNVKEIEDLTNNFIEIQEQLMNVASISEENSAATQEILSYIEEENSQIGYIHESIDQIRQLSGKMKEQRKQMKNV